MVSSSSFGRFRVGITTEKSGVSRVDWGADVFTAMVSFAFRHPDHLAGIS
jgi:hypothetical protein